jgi:tellurite methyltransferase
VTQIYDYEFDLEPAPFLVDHIDLLPKGRVLDIAMGAGRNAIYLARMGFEVEGVDSSEHAIQHALERAKESGVTIQAEVADLEKNYRIKPDTYNVIICFNYLQRSLIPQIKDGLKKGGVVVYETFTVDQAQFGHPRNPDFLLRHNELMEMFRGFRCLRYREGVIEKRKAIASMIAVKV